MSRRIRGARQLALVLLVALLASACAQTSRRVPQPELFSSPLVAPETERLYLPMALRPQMKFKKLGLAGCPRDCAAFGCSWCYSWSADPGRLEGVETVPMIWDEQRVADRIGGNSLYLMGPNECDKEPQCNLSPQELVKTWTLIEARANSLGMKLVAPVTAYNNMGWLDKFVEAYSQALGKRPRFDVIPVHCYWNTAVRCIQNVEYGIAQAKAYGASEVWVTEFFFSQQTEAWGFIQYLEAQPWVTRYSPFVSLADCSERAYWDCELGGDPSVMQPDLILPSPMGKWYAQPEQG